jgi:hypothetical protein
VAKPKLFSIQNLENPNSEICSSIISITEVYMQVIHTKMWQSLYAALHRKYMILVAYDYPEEIQLLLCLSTFVSMKLDFCPPTWTFALNFQMV